MSNPSVPMSYDEKSGAPIYPQQTVAEMSMNIASEVLNIDEKVIETLKQMFRATKLIGYRENKEKNVVEPVYEIEKGRTPLINERGFNELPIFVNNSINKIIPRCNISRDMILLQCKELEKNFILKMINDYEKWGVQPSNVPQFVSGVVWLVFNSLSRAEDGNTLGGLVKGVQIVEHVNREEKNKSLFTGYRRR